MPTEFSKTFLGKQLLQVVEMQVNQCSEKRDGSQIVASHTIQPPDIAASQRKFHSYPHIFTHRHLKYP
jgi:hypothetical protein